MQVHNEQVGSSTSRLNVRVQSTKVSLPVDVQWGCCREAMGGKGSESQQCHISTALCRVA